VKIIEKEFNVITGQETISERDETAAEIKERLKYEEEMAITKELSQTNATKKAALLAKLGITDDEAKLLLS
jgi:ribosome-associated toxin RatA of RatAB toxin-antitoxin module